MAVTPVTTLAVVPKNLLWSPAMAKEPLHRTLLNLNYLWAYHRPPLLSVVYTVAPALSRSVDYHIPILPSQETGGLRYTFEHRFVCSSGAATVQVTVDSCTTYAGGGTVWTNVYTQSVSSSGAGVLTTSVSSIYVIPTAAVALRVTYGAPSAGTRTDHHFLVYPAPSAPSAGTYSTGYRPYDDGILAAAGAPIHEELLQRCAISSRAVVEDRRHCAFAFVQEYTTTPHFVANAATGAESGRTMPWVRGWVPATTGQSFAARVIATVSAGTTADLVSLGGVTFDASGSIESGTVTLNPKPDGALDWVLDVTATTGNSTRVLAVVAFWLPTVPQDNVVAWASAKWPSAQVSYLATAVERVEQAALGPYAATGHLFDGCSATTLQTRYLGAMVPPGWLRYRFSVSQTGSFSSLLTAPDYSVVTTTTAGSVDAKVPWALVGYGDGNALGGDFGGVGSASDIVTCENVDIASDGNGLLAVTLASAPAVEPIVVQYASGLCVWPQRKLENMENLP